VSKTSSPPCPDVMQRQTSAEVQVEKEGSERKPGTSPGKAECTASLALTMLLMLKRFLKATYNMSEERIAAFSPDLPDKRKQVSTAVMNYQGLYSIHPPWCPGKVFRHMQKDAALVGSAAIT